MKRIIIAITGLIFFTGTGFCNSNNTLFYGPQRPDSAQGKKAIISDSTRKVAKIKPYQEVITSKAISDFGLLTSHKVEERYLFELPDTMFGKDILVVTRISKAATANRPNNGFSGYAGDELDRNVVRFEKGPNYKVFLKNISYNGDRSADSNTQGMYLAVQNSNIQPIIASFEIKAYSKDSSGIVIDLTDYINGDNSLFSFSATAKKAYKLAGLQADKSFVSTVTSFPTNTEVQTLKTFISGEGGFATYELNTSLLLLPVIPMQIRHYDARVGYFSTEYRNFDAPQEAKIKTLTVRWRMEPKEEDIPKYLRDELVEPKKQLVYYIDPATPKKWIPYLIAGVNEWQKAFEQAGFKNAIIAKEAPTNDPEWSLYDARHSAIVYKPSFVANASGPNVNDPRTGEILESHINWYHNVMQLVRDWYMIQAGPNDPRARKMVFDEELMGELIKFVCAHEVGHTLGLLHNFGSSSTVPVEKLRDKNYLQENGHCPSIMDYARFNYIAQPEDKIPADLLMPRIGVYDKWAIEWGYRWFPPFKSEDEEKTFFNNWVIKKTGADKRLWFGMQFPFGVIDYRCQSEDLGDNAMKAGTYGIKNLQRVMDSIFSWSRVANEGITGNLYNIRTQLYGQYFRYINHVLNYFTNPRLNWKTVEETGSQIEYPSGKLLVEAMSFLDKELFTTPNWLINKKMENYIGGNGISQPLGFQRPALEKLLSYETYSQLSIKASSTLAKNEYSYDDLLRELSSCIWRELKSGSPIDFSRRALQVAYVRQLSAGANGKQLLGFPAIMKQHIRELQPKVNSALLATKDKDTRVHLAYIKDLLKEALESKPPVAAEEKPKIGIADQSILQLIEESSRVGAFPLNCWDDTLRNDLFNPVYE